MKCVNCGRPVTPGNSRIVIKNGKKFREHRKCHAPLINNRPFSKSELERFYHAKRLTPQEVRELEDNPPGVRSVQAKASEPDTAVQASVSRDCRYFVNPGTLERLERVSGNTVYHGLINIDVHIVPASLLEDGPDFTAELTEIFIGRK